MLLDTIHSAIHSSWDLQRYIKPIEKYIKNAKFIHVLRNGEDVVASTIRTCVQTERVDRVPRAPGVRGDLVPVLTAALGTVKPASIECRVRAGGI